MNQMINNFEPMVNTGRAQQNQPKDIVTCTKCKCEWFEQVKINQYKGDHIVIPGQAVPVGGPQEFIALRCIKCTALYQPKVMITAQDITTKLYNEMLDQLEAPQTPVL